MKLHVKKGDMVKVITGSSKGKTGRILLVDMEKNRAVVEGANIITKHSKPNAKSPQGGIIKTEAPIQISNLMLIDHQGNPTRIGRRLDEKTNRLVRYSKKSGEVIK